MARVVETQELGNIIRGSTYCMEWSALQVAARNESVCGDEFVVNNYRDQVLLGAIDGLGHGEQALKASSQAKKSLKSFSGQSLISLVNSCHDELRQTRGAVMSLVVIDNWEQTMTWIGIGNVEGTLYRSNGSAIQKDMEHILLRGGVVGYQLPTLKASIISITPGDLLILTTDGVNNDYKDRINVNLTTDGIVGQISSRYIDQSDDALVIAARYAGVEF